MTNSLTPGTWALDKAHSSVTFGVRHLGIATVRGRFNDVDAELTVGATPTDHSVTATIALASIDTGNDARDGHVRGADFLDVDNRPTLTYRSTSVTVDEAADGATWTVQGELTIGGKTASVPLTVEVGGVQDFIDGHRRGGFDATAKVRRSDYGVGPEGPMLSDVITVQLGLEFVEPAAG